MSGLFLGHTVELAWGSCIFAGISAVTFVLALRERKMQKQYKKKIRHGFLVVGEDEEASVSVMEKGLTGRAIIMMCEQSRVLSFQSGHHFFTKGIWTLNTKRFYEILPQTGLAEQITQDGYVYTRTLCCLLGFCFGALMGVVFSTEFMILLGLLGLIGGWRFPLKALIGEKNLRKNDLEHHLSEMLEVVSLGLRSGLAFDQALALYHEHFETNIGRESASAQTQWQLGLRTREEALRAWALRYDSVLFTRVVENIVRSLRFGSSLAETLEASALEARALYKTCREEKVAKAPVKMLIPTAALILPAMLLLVLGPVMLEMMQGF